MTESEEHLESAAAIAGESSAVPFDERYFEGITQVLLLVGGHERVPRTSLTVKARNHRSMVEDCIERFKCLIRKSFEWFPKYLELRIQVMLTYIRSMCH